MCESGNLNLQSREWIGARNPSISVRIANAFLDRGDRLALLHTSMNSRAPFA